MSDNHGITGGTVSFEQSRKLAEYENRKAVITFNVTSETDAVNAINFAASLAQAKVLELLGLGPKLVENVTQARSKTDIINADAGKVDVSSPGIKNLNDKADKKAAKGGTVKKPAAEKPAEAADPAAVGDPEPEITKNPENRVDPTAAVDPAAVEDDPLTASPPEITDAQLHDMVARKNAVVRSEAKAAGKDENEGTKLIKVLNSKYTPGQVAMIPKELRAKYLKELDALKFAS